MPTFSREATGTVLAKGNIAAAVTPVLVWTVPANCYADITSFSLSNAFTAGISAWVWAGAAGESPALANSIVPARTILAKDCLPLNDVLTTQFPAGYQFWLQQSVPNALVYSISGFLR